MPFTLIPEEPAAPASGPTKFQIIDETPQAPATDPRESFAAGIASTLPMAYGAGALNYALEGGAPGSFDQGYQQFQDRSNKAWEDNPKTAAAGMGTGIGLGLATGGPGLVSGAARMAPRAGEIAIRGAAPVVKYGWAPAHALSGDLAGSYAIYRGGKALGTLGQALKAARTGGNVGKIADGLSPEDISKLFEVLKKAGHGR